jgi:hypothetical protein
MIPDEAGKIMCQQFKAGQDVWDWPRDCSLLPTNACNNLCNSEKQRYIDAGHQNWEAGIKNNTDWWKEPYTKVYTFGTVNERLEIFQPDAHPWGAAPNEDDLLKMEIGYSHYYNMPYAGNNFFNLIEAIDPETNYHSVAYKEDQVPEELKPAIRRNLEGDIARNKTIPGVEDANKAAILFNGFHPAFIKQNISEWKHMVDLEADGVMIDNLGGAPGNKFPADYFDDYTVQEFGKYLQEKLTASDWKKLGANPASFNYADYLRSKGFTSASFQVEDESWRNIPLVLEFRAFIGQKNAEAFRTMSEQIRAYAESQGRHITVSANMTDRVGTIPAEASVDFITSEFGYISVDKPYQYRSVAPFSKFALAKGKDYLNVIVIDNYGTMNEFVKSDPGLYVDIYRLGIMESYAVRSSQIYLRTEGLLSSFGKDPLGVYKLRQDTGRLEQIKPAFDFMRRYKSYFKEFNTSNARAAMIFSNDLAYQFRLEGAPEQHYEDDLRIGNDLYRLGVDYDVIAPRMSFDNYKVILLPRSPHLPDADAQKLLDFVKAGGTLILLNRPEEGGALLKPGKQGSGEIVTFNPDKPEEQAKIAPYIKEIAGAIESDSAPPLSAISYSNGKGNYVVHLMTSVTDLGHDFPVLKNVHVTLPFPIEGLNVSYASLENPDLVPLDAENIIVPAIQTYGLLLIEKP